MNNSNQIVVEELEDTLDHASHSGKLKGLNFSDIQEVAEIVAPFCQSYSDQQVEAFAERLRNQFRMRTAFGGYKAKVTDELLSYDESEIIETIDNALTEHKEGKHG